MITEFICLKYLHYMTVLSLCHGHDFMVVGFIATYAIGAYVFESCSYKVCLIQHYLIKLDRSVVFSGSSGFFHQ